MTEEKRLHVFTMYAPTHFIPFPTKMHIVAAPTMDAAFASVKTDPTVANLGFAYMGNVTKQEVVDKLGIQTVVLNAPITEAKVDPAQPMDYESLSALLKDNGYVVYKKK